MSTHLRYAIALKSLREAKGLSAQQLSKASQLAPYTVSRVECGKLYLDLPMTVALCEQLDISLDSFVKTAKDLPEQLLEHEQSLLAARQHVNVERKTSKAARRQAVSKLLNN